MNAETQCSMSACSGITIVTPKYCPSKNIVAGQTVRVEPTDQIWNVTCELRANSIGNVSTAWRYRNCKKAHWPAEHRSVVTHEASKHTVDTPQAQGTPKVARFTECWGLKQYDLSTATFAPQRTGLFSLHCFLSTTCGITMSGGPIGSSGRLCQPSGNEKLIERYRHKAKEDEDAIRGLEEAKRVLEEQNKILADEIQKLWAENTRLSSFLRKANRENAEVQKMVIQEWEGKDAVQRLLEREQDHATKARAAYQQEIGNLRSQLVVKESETSEARTENAKLQKMVMQEREGKEAAQRSLEREQKKATKARAAYQQEIGTLKHELDTETRKPRTELQRSQTKLTKLTALLDTRSRELKGAQAFLTTADARSEVEVITLLDALNLEVMQTCAFISESFDFTRKPEHATEACGRISELMGPTMLHLLSTVQHSEDPLLVQIALQGVMAEFSRLIIITWDYHVLQAKQPLMEIYNDIRASGKFASSGDIRMILTGGFQKRRPSADVGVP